MFQRVKIETVIHLFNTYQASLKTEIRNTLFRQRLTNRLKISYQSVHKIKSNHLLLSLKLMLLLKEKEGLRSHKYIPISYLTTVFRIQARNNMKINVTVWKNTITLRVVVILKKSESASREKVLKENDQIQFTIIKMFPYMATLARTLRW